jgi:hypothetical protein
VGEGGVTSAVVVPGINVVLPETDDPGAVGEVFPVVATSVVGVV